MSLPTTVTLMLRFHFSLLPPAMGVASNSHLNTPSTADVTLKIFRLTLFGIQLKLNLEVKAPNTSDNGTDGIILAMSISFNCTSRDAKLSSLRLKFHLSVSLVDPSRRRMLCIRSSAGFETSPTGGGSYQETIPFASKNKEHHKV